MDGVLGTCPLRLLLSMTFSAVVYTPIITVIISQLKCGHNFLEQSKLWSLTSPKPGPGDQRGPGGHSPDSASQGVTAAWS